MIDRFFQASLLTFLLSLILQLGGSASKNPLLESNYFTHAFSSQVTKPVSKAMYQGTLGWISHFEGLDPIRRLQKKFTVVPFSAGVSKDSQP